MGRANDLHKSALTPHTNEMKLVFLADPLAVRQALKASMTGLARLHLTADERGMIEIVLAEVLNNVVEHAYGQDAQGIIELQIKRAGDQLHFTVLDDGVPLSDGNIPQTPRQSLSGPVSHLPEGGFGWSLIKELTRDLRYMHRSNRNKLVFTISLADTRIS
ncbi:ATP-binding protein [uncultured Aliiroseovarius sp.]|uniref:ATP-binding protein n=1 Tax=uncultured Aliiroseovarius sp. TaxID=1658783 RepID=UPI002598B4D3|nr:ATP-binding protein [uncultured Aliiroseovarius sp.]